MALTPLYYTPNPNVPFVSFVVNGSGIDFANEDRPQHLMEFSCTMLLDTAGMWKIKLWDPEYNKIEQTLLDHNGEGVTIQFGWNGGDGSLKSPKFSGWISDFQPVFGIGGKELTISGFTSEVAALTNDSRAYPDSKLYSGHKAGMLISEIVEDICKRNGWEVEYIEKTQSNADYSDIDTTTRLEQPFIQGGTDWQFITEVLAPRARSAVSAEQGGYSTLFNFFTKKLTFCPNRASRLAPVATLNYTQDKMSEITDFQPNFQGLQLFIGSGKASGHCIEDLSKKVSSSTDSQKGTDLPGATDPKKVLPPKPMQDKLDTESCVMLNTMDGAANLRNIEALKIYNRAVWNAIADQSMATVQVTIVGRPDTDTIKYLPGQNLKINVMQPFDNTPDYLSGKFWIQGVTHIITPNGFKTQLSLIKNSSGSGDASVSLGEAGDIISQIQIAGIG